MVCWLAARNLQTMACPLTLCSLLLLPNAGLTPEVPDSNTYTPMHAAASYAQLDVLTYLLSKGGNINVTDDEGETPLFTVESVETARWLVERGADPSVVNNEGQNVRPTSPLPSSLSSGRPSPDPRSTLTKQAADFLEEDAPEVSAYLRTLLPGSSSSSRPLSDEASDADDVSSLLTNEHLSSLMAERLSEDQTTELMAKFEEIMKRCEEDGVNRDEELAERTSSLPCLCRPSLSDPLNTCATSASCTGCALRSHRGRSVDERRPSNVRRVGSGR